MSDSSKSMGGSATYTGGVASHATVTATLNNYIAGEYVDDFDQLKPISIHKRMQSRCGFEELTIQKS